MEYLADTVTIIRHFSGAGRIGSLAREILSRVDEGEHRLHISIISMVEILYLSEKRRIKINLKEALDVVQGSSNYTLVDLNSRILQTAEQINFPEIFDRLILATAQYLKVPLITSDRKIRAGNLVESIWT